jgi:chromosome segregation ATPase
MLKEDQVAQMKKDIAEEEKEILEIKEAHEKATSEQSDLRNQITNLEEDIKGIRDEIHSLEHQRRINADKYNDLLPRVESKQKMLDEDAHEKEVQALFEKQPTFWLSIGARIDHYQKEMNAGFEKSDSDIASEKVAEKFHETAVQSRSFSPLAGALRSGEGAYRDFMRSLCEKQIAGQRLTAQEKRHRIQIIDNCLLSQEVEPHWA